MTTDRIEGARLWVVYFRYAGTRELFQPVPDVHGHAIAFTKKADAEYFARNERSYRGRGQVRVLEVRPVQ